MSFAHTSSANMCLCATYLESLQVMVLAIFYLCQYLIFLIKVCLNLAKMVELFSGKF